MISRLLAISIGLALNVHTPNARPSTMRPYQAAVAPSASAARAPVPFGTGERLVFDVRFGNLKVGNSQMQVHGIETVRGRETWQTSFAIQGGTFFYKVNDRFESWIDTRTMSSLRFIKRLEEGSRDTDQEFEFFPERSSFIERSKRDAKEERSVREPLDDGSFLYFVRTIPLRTGETYDFNRYFRPDRNPVRIKVLRRERVTVPAGTFNAIVIQPIIKSRGIFAEKGQAEVWLSDDPARMILQLRSRLSFGSLNLFLTSYTPAKTPRTATQ